MPSSAKRRRATASSVTRWVTVGPRRVARMMGSLCSPPDARMRMGMAANVSGASPTTRWRSEWSTGRPSTSRKVPSTSPTAPACRRLSSSCATMLVDARMDLDERSPTETMAMSTDAARASTSSSPGCDSSAARMSVVGQ